MNGMGFLLGGLAPLAMKQPGLMGGLVPGMLSGMSGSDQPQQGQDQSGQQALTFLNQGAPRGGFQGAPSLSDFLQGRLGR